MSAEIDKYTKYDPDGIAFSGDDVTLYTGYEFV